MSGKPKAPQSPPQKKPSRTPPRKSGNADELYDDGDIATPKRDFDEEQVKEEEDKRM